MSAKNLKTKDPHGAYFHIYNKGVENRILFNDEEDYHVFLGFLKGYLTAPLDPEHIKKDFTVNGRIFRGTPHQPKNYLNKIELIAFSLNPDRFHLVLRPLAKGSLENFIRSLCTRYSIYFNKRYKRTGSLFDGPYKSIQVQDEPTLLHLTQYLHHTGENSSYKEYLGTRHNPWVKSEAVLSCLGNGADEYKNLVEKYELDQKAKELIKDITFESGSQNLARRDLIRHVKNFSSEIPTESISLDQKLKPLQRIPEFMATAIVFLFLVTFGIRNITISAAKSPDLSPTPSVLSETVKIDDINPSPSPTFFLQTEATDAASNEIEEPKLELTVKIDDESSSVNIRRQPTTSSEKIGQAKDGDIFEFIAKHSGWYEVKLADESNGFISAKYIKAGEVNN